MVCNLIYCKSCWQVLPTEECSACPNCGHVYGPEDAGSYYGYPYKWYRLSDFIAYDIVVIWIILALLVWCLPVSPLYTAPVAFLSTQNMFIPEALFDQTERKLKIFQLVVNEFLLIAMLSIAVIYHL